MAKTVIKRLGLKEDSAVFAAKALAAIAGEENIIIILNGPWRTTQGCTVVEDKDLKKGLLSWDGRGLAVCNPETRISANGHGATVDIIARVERVIEGSAS